MGPPALHEASSSNQGSGWAPSGPAAPWETEPPRAARRPLGGAGCRAWALPRAGVLTLRRYSGRVRRLACLGVALLVCIARRGEVAPVEQVLAQVGGRGHICTAPPPRSTTRPTHTGRPPDADGRNSAQRLPRLSRHGEHREAACQPKQRFYTIRLNPDLNLSSNPASFERWSKPRLQATASVQTRDRLSSLTREASTLRPTCNHVIGLQVCRVILRALCPIRCSFA